MTIPADLLAPVPTLVVRTVEIGDPGDLTRVIPTDVAPHDVVSWQRGGDGMVGWGRAASVCTIGPQRFTHAQSWWRQVAEQAVVRSDVNAAGSGLVAFGSFAFSDGSGASSSLVVPSVLVGRRDGIAWLTTVSTASRIPAAPQLSVSPPADTPGEITFSDGSLSAPGWESAVGASVQRIQAGELDKVVMARDVRADAERAIDPRHLLARLTTAYDRTWTFAVDGLVGATPEMLVRTERGLVTSRVLAGTIRRTGDDAHDLQLAGALARSSKDLEEHEYAVRSVADALAPHCSSMNLPESPFVLHLPNVMHLATDVTGVLDEATTSLALAAALHPSAAVCGTPTPVAAAVIDELEGMDRDRYAGPVGWIGDNGDGDWGIALRCGLLDRQNPRTIRLFAGCGIVAGSDPEAELAESNAKLLPIREALASD